MAGTLALTAADTTPIQAIEVGDLVVSRDAATGEQVLKPVTQTFVNSTDELVHVRTDDETITATPSHPFWVEGTGWVDGGKLEAGMSLSLADGGRATILSVTREKLASPQDVYNFEVADFHTYFVASAGVWVHNSCVRANKAAGAAFERRLGMDTAKKGIRMSSGKMRFPDRVTRHTIEDAKHVRRLRWSPQLEDYATHAAQRQKKFVLHVRSDTRLSGKAMRKALRSGRVIIRRYAR